MRFFDTSGHIMRQIVCAEQTYVIGTGIDHLIQTDMCGLLDLELCSVALYCVVLFRVSESSRIPGRCRTDGCSNCSKRSIFWLGRQIGLDRVFADRLLWTDRLLCFLLWFGRIDAAIEARPEQLDQWLLDGIELQGVEQHGAVELRD